MYLVANKIQNHSTSHTLRLLRESSCHGRFTGNKCGQLKKKQLQEVDTNCTLDGLLKCSFMPSRWRWLQFLVPNRKIPWSSEFPLRFVWGTVSDLSFWMFSPWNMASVPMLDMIIVTTVGCLLALRRYWENKCLGYICLFSLFFFRLLLSIQRVWK